MSLKREKHGVTSGLSLTGIRFGAYTVVPDKEPIGTGSYGMVLEVEDKSGKRMVMKLFREEEHCQTEFDAHQRVQTAVARDAAHLSIFPFLVLDHAVLTPPLCYIVMPLVDAPDLWAVMKRRKMQPDEAATILTEAWLALDFLHNRAGVLHLDIKPPNMLWSGNKLTIIDFSLWEQWPVPDDRVLSRTYCTRGFRPPEMVTKTDSRIVPSQVDLRRVFCPAVDWWALGCSAALLACALNEPAHRPMIRTDEWAFEAVRSKQKARVAPVGHFLRRVLDLLLQQEPCRRQSFHDGKIFRAMQEQAAIIKKSEVIERR